jgi:hypothetical protein
MGEFPLTFKPRSLLSVSCLLGGAIKVPTSQRVLCQMISFIFRNPVH